MGVPRRRRLNLLNIRIFSEEASSAAPLGPMLGQYFLPIAEFTATFNDNCELFGEGVELPTLVLKTLDEPFPFYFYVRRPSLTFTLYSLFDHGSQPNLLPLNVAYDLVRLISIYDTDGDVRYASRMVFGFLKSTRFSISVST